MPELDISNATPIDFPLERSLYIGVILSGILYGVNISLFCASMHCISCRPPEYRKSQKVYLVIGAILLGLVTIQLASVGLRCQFIWIDHRNYPGGPVAFFYGVSEGMWYTSLGFAVDAAASLLCDGLLLYRCFMIWGSQWHIRVIVLPTLIYLASFVTAIIAVVEEGLRGGHSVLLNSKPVDLTVPWISLSVSFNVMVTSMICFRILRMRALMRGVLPPEMSNMYTSIVTMLIESAAPLSILGICVVITTALNVPLFFAFGYVWSMFCSLSPQIIILQVAMNRSWLRETANELNTALIFAQPATDCEQIQQSQVGRMTICSTEDPDKELQVPFSVTTTSAAQLSSKKVGSEVGSAVWLRSLLRTEKGEV